MLLSRSGRVCTKPRSAWLHSSFRKSLSLSSGHIQEGDRAFLRYRDHEPVFTKPLGPNGITYTRWGDVSHDSLIGKQARELVTTSKGREIRVYLPTLGDYVTETPRLVTPIYPADANLIVSLLDIHVSPRDLATEIEPPLEILEAGTGHGALTLYLARAIHAANPPASTKEKDLQRGAIIHSLEISQRHSEHAKQIVEGFRRGIYINDVDFHVSDVSKWIDNRIFAREQEQGEPSDQKFLSHVILDLPSSHSHIEKAASVLHTHGNLLIFNPSVTQINACVQLIKDKSVSLTLDRVLELGPAVTAGREWDIRFVKPRALLKAESEKKVTNETPIADKMRVEAIMEGTKRNEEEARASAEGTGWETICRPKPFGRTMGGGFLAMWTKMR